MTEKEAHSYNFQHMPHATCVFEVKGVEPKYSMKRPDPLIRAVGRRCTDEVANGRCLSGYGSNTTSEHVAAMLDGWKAAHQDVEVTTNPKINDLSPELGGIISANELDLDVETLRDQEAVAELEGGFPVPVIKED